MSTNTSNSEVVLIRLFVFKGSMIMVLHPGVTNTRIKNRFKTLEVDFIKVHGDLYGYSQSEYCGIYELIDVMCNIHKTLFKIAPNKHLSGRGCQLCGNLRRGGADAKKEKAKLNFQKKVEKIHPNKFLYHLVEYDGCKGYVELVCKKCDKPFFKQPIMLYAGKGCPDCGKKIVADYQKGKSIAVKKTFLRRVEDLNSGRYNLNSTYYINAKTKVTAICKKHNEELTSTPRQLLSGVGCKKCTDESRNIHNKKTFEKARFEFADKAERVHPNKYLYNLVDYIGVNDKVKIWCRTCDEPFTIQANSFLRGSGCNICSPGGFRSNKPAILYYLRVETFNQVAWKIGITNRSVNDRFSLSDLELITEIRIIHYEKGQDAYDEEQRILKLHKKHQYKGDPLLQNGNTELFDRDVLELDNDYEG